MKRSGRLRSLSPKRQAEGARSSLTPSPGPTRRAWINRTVKVKVKVKGAKPKKPLAKSNPERQARRRKAYAVKLAAYKRSETYKIVEARAAGCCERRFKFDGLPARCGNGRANDIRLTHHHKTYARFGGKELPEDIEVLCKYHNEEAESQHPTRNRNYGSRAATLTGERT